MRPLSEATARVASKNFSRKYIALGRLVKQWPEIMGDEFADKTQPIKLNYRKGTKDRKSTATLDVATSSSYATILPYQKGVILERINNVFGDSWITDIRFLASEVYETASIPHKRPAPMSIQDKKYLSGLLDEIDDPEFKERLESLGKAVIADLKVKENTK